MVLDDVLHIDLIPNSMYLKKIAMLAYYMVFRVFAIFVVVIANLFCLKSERHKTRHVGRLGTLECLRSNRFLNFELEV